jgi:hypothetical protein
MLLLARAGVASTLGASVSLIQAVTLLPIQQMFAASLQPLGC